MSQPHGQTTIASERTALARLSRWAPKEVHEVLTRLLRRGGEAMLVGGAVRDAFLGRRSADWDIATSLPPAEVASLFPRVVRAGERHGTIMVVTAAGPVEVTTYRHEGAYLDARRPAHVEFHADIDGDLARRDFTMNALAADLVAQRIIDPFGGVRDLGRGIVRSVGDALARFAEDGLRPLRAVRFSGVLDFRLDPRTRAAIPRSLVTFERVSWERKRDEMVRLLGRGRGFSRVGTLLAEGGLLGVLAPELARASPRRLAALDRLQDGAPWLRFAAWAALAGLTPEQAGDVLRRWRVSKADVHDVEAWLLGHVLLGAGSPPAGAHLRRWLSRVGVEHTAGAVCLARVLRGRAYATFPSRVRRELARRPPLRIEDLSVRGRDLVAKGLAGAAIGQALRRLLDVVLDAPHRNRRSVLLGLVHTMSTGSKRE